MLPEMEKPETLENFLPLSQTAHEVMFATYVLSLHNGQAAATPEFLVEAIAYLPDMAQKLKGRGIFFANIKSAVDNLAQKRKNNMEFGSGKAALEEITRRAWAVAKSRGASTVSPLDLLVSTAEIEPWDSIKFVDIFHFDPTSIITQTTEESKTTPTIAVKEAA